MADELASESAIATEIGAETTREGPLLPILHRLQARFGHVPEAALPMIAEALNIGRAEVHGVVSFYHDFRSEPVDRPVVKICRAEACQAQGGRALEAAARDVLGGRAAVEAVYCLGLCANGPAALVAGRPVAGATAEKLAAELGR